MKKYNSIFVISGILAILLLFLGVYAISSSSYIPVIEDAELTGELSGGSDSVFINVARLLCPVLAAVLAVLAVVAFLKAKTVDGLCNRLFNKRGGFSPLHVFIICSAILSVSSLIYAAVHRNDVWDHYIFRSGADMFMDFFNHITYVRKPSEVYSVSVHACFPPFIYIFYYLLSLILPTDATVKHDASLTSPYAIVMYVLYMAVCCILLYIIINKLLKSFGEKTSLTVTLLTIISSVFITVTERGNSVLLVLLLLLAAMKLRESEKTSHRELALLCIAAAAGIKIYPAIFGLLYISEKRWKEAARLVLYGVLFFFVPFAFFGGFEGLRLFIENQMAIHDDVYTSLTSISSAVRYFADSVKGDPLAWESAAEILPVVFTVLSLVAFFNRKLALWEKVMLLVSVIAFVPAWSGSYTAVFFAAPMILFFKETRGSFGTGLARIYNVLCAFCFSLAFSLIIFVTKSGNVLYELRYAAMYLLVVLVLLRALVCAVKGVRKKRDEGMPVAAE